MKPRQPASKAFGVTRCQVQLRLRPGKNEKSIRILPPLLTSEMIMKNNESFMRALKCRECGREYPLTATHVCEFDFGPLEVVYDYDRIKKSMGRPTIQS